MKELLVHIEVVGYTNKNNVLHPTDFTKEATLKLTMPENMDFETFYKTILKRMETDYEN